MQVFEEAWASESPLPIRSSQQQSEPSLETLPEELVQLIFELIPPLALRNISLVSHWAYSHATAFLWRDISLVDCWKLHPRESGPPLFSERGCGDSDEHDDTPMIQRLLVLARNPFLASKVQKVTHRCHLPTPGIFNELPTMYFQGKNLSQDPRTLKLLRLAILNMVNVHTLRIVFGHWNITKGLLEGFLDPSRPRRIPLRRLWLESCSLDGAEIDFGIGFDLSGLESVRFRRLRVEFTPHEPDVEVTQMKFPEFELSRGGYPKNLHNGAGGYYQTTINFGVFSDTRVLPYTEEDLRTLAQKYDDTIYEALPGAEVYIESQPLPTTGLSHPTKRPGVPLLPMIHILNMGASSLTKINLDWILLRRDERVPHSPSQVDTNAESMLYLLSSLVFPNLRAFQLRNGVVNATRLPRAIYLLESCDEIGGPIFLKFLEAHPKLQCLAWPMNRFYSHKRATTDIVNRARDVVAQLGRTLVDLRVDSYYDSQGETFTDEGSLLPIDIENRIRRRRFISEFASQMTKIEQIKMEGGIPRDEKRETIRALHACPLKKIVLIGVSNPIGNTWGLEGADLKKIDEGGHDYSGHLEEEFSEAIFASAITAPTAPENFHFEPQYGWPPSPPMIHTIAAHHASTITELKFCGYNGSPILSKSTPITQPLLYPLRHFHNLRQLVLSMWLLTNFEGEDRDDEIIASWLDTRSPTSTALVVVTPAGTFSNTTPSPPPPPVAPTVASNSPLLGPAPDYNRWAVTLRTKFSPSALAYRVAADIAPHLSPEAKARPGGVRVRASFCLGTATGDIFDLDIRIGRNDQVLEFVGPREEGEKGRWWDKLEGRRWF
ncbi:hypothetical protein K432DRAFT_327616 [Lepidopterella palustris CBS 459.81]|uniref:F-box domain-containing protein n=1 Tax=Lepidopterella palustris CBS 459.81 TaxID=1314670 RepID=A0A8E2EBA4_9PEZI|nr:hypothetical protein K432DRAFT_327616 [Lepidopterella palustris CBS 459.81]